ncbi:MAG: DUF4258 domain-containing protein [Rhodospirillales bacterium]
MRMDVRRAESIVRAIALDSKRVCLTHHAVKRMHEREFSSRDLFSVLREGHVRDAPESERGEWKFKVIKRLRGSREAGVITVLTREEKLLVLTMEWEDWK